MRNDMNVYFLNVSLIQLTSNFFRITLECHITFQRNFEMTVNFQDILVNIHILFL